MTLYTREPGRHHLHVREATDAEILAHPAVAALVAERDRLRTVLDAERGVRGMPGWRWLGAEWEDSDGGVISPVFDPRKRCRVWRLIGSDGRMLPGTYDFALEAMEAAARAAKETP